MVITRKYPNFLTAAVSGLVPLPVQSANMGQPFAGAVPFTRVTDPVRDPDLPPPPIGKLYTHPQCPGLLLSTVSSTMELFRRGSSFIIQDTQNNTLWGFFGAYAEDVLLGKPRALPANAFLQLGVGAVFSAGVRGLTTAELAELKALAGGHRTPHSGRVFPYYTPDQPGGYTPQQVRDAMVGLEVDLPLGNAALTTPRYTSMQIAPYIADLVGAVPGNSWRIMAVHTSAQFGWFVNSTIPAQRNAVTLGFLGHEVALPKLSALVASHRAEFVAGAPDKCDEAFGDAFDDEFAALKAKDYIPRMLFGTVISRDIAIDKPHFQTGFVVESVEELGTNALLTPSFDHPCSTPGSLRVRPIPGQDAKALATYQASMLWATGKVSGNDLVTDFAKPVVGPLSLPRELTPKIVVTEAAAMVTANSSTSAINAATLAAGATVQVGGVNQVVPTTIGKHLMPDLAFDALRSRWGYAVGLRSREFFRRTLQRAEQYVRAM